MRKAMALAAIGPLLVLAAVFLALPASAGGPYNPSGDLQVTVTNQEAKEIQASGWYSNSLDWGACLSWGDETSVCFPGANGSFEEWHQYMDYGTYSVTFKVTGAEGTIPFEKTEVVVFDPPALPPNPTGTLAITVTSEEAKEIQASGWYTAATNWGACVKWGDEQGFCLPGAMGFFTETHQYTSTGIYSVTLVVTGVEGTTPFSTTEAVTLESPVEPEVFRVLLPQVLKSHSAPKPPGCQITNVVGPTAYDYTTTVEWWSAPTDWHLLHWGDNQSVGFQGPSGKSTWTHIYNQGAWEQKVVFSDGQVACTATIQVP